MVPRPGVRPDTRLRPPCVPRCGWLPETREEAGGGSTRQRFWPHCTPGCLWVHPWAGGWLSPQLHGARLGGRLGAPHSASGHVRGAGSRSSHRRLKWSYSTALKWGGLAWVSSPWGVGLLPRVQWVRPGPCRTPRDAQTTHHMALAGSRHHIGLHSPALACGSRPLAARMRVPEATW